MARRQVGLKLEPGLVERLDAAAAAVGLTRTAWIESAVERQLFLGGAGGVWGDAGD